jgi:undecaprenyl-diphosphatase
MNALETWNRKAFLAWNADLSATTSTLNFAAVIAEYLVYLIPLALVAMWCWGSPARRESALKICVVALVSLGINQLLAFGYPHSRPSELGIGHTFIQHAADSSFPSDHALSLPR